MNLFFSDKQLFVGAVDADRSERCGDQDGQHSDGEYDLSAGQSHGERNGANRSLNGCFWKIGDHTKQPLFFV